MPDLAAVVMAMVLALYWRRVARLWEQGGRGAVVHVSAAVAFTSGAAAVVVAVVGPIAKGAESSLAVHMAQHLLLLNVAPPLLAVGDVLTAFAVGPPSPLRRRLRQLNRRVGTLRRPAAWAGALAASALLQTALLLGWHAPVFYEAAARNDLIHGAEHASFVASSFLLWAVIVHGRRRVRGAAVLVLFAASFPAAGLGFLMMLARDIWYPVYGSNATALERQQLAGAAMWGVGGGLTVIAAATLFATWLVGLDSGAAAPARGARGAARRTADPGHIATSHAKEFAARVDLVARDAERRHVLRMRVMCCLDERDVPDEHRARQAFDASH